ncbi:orotidine-5'-phosphate decarboxylase [Methanofollis aquaemaris]|uniref:Orotidine 5'-phosphate decarboxylase n=1 Tax=Methanofollis aquaemaris TaxID=126734 RepID=A0A8A3S6I4_9EURY|nr:orotidine-5'-phosphate decarboxylase [Methanofollis aquaemaris]QSZ67543.1 orotidine-5'-phosphate decarboxylase [Methanofollis aquaemaris]
MTDLVLSLDVTDRTSALSIAAACAEEVDAIKVGYPLVLGTGLGIARDLADLGLPLIADFKVADIPNTNMLICDQVFEAGFSAVIAQAFPGPDSIAACVESAHAHGGECYVVAEMSHPGALTFFSEGVPEAICRLVVENGADGIIAPATRPARIKVLRNLIGEKKILSPGVGAQGGDPAEVAPLVDGMIVGRAIYGAVDPAAAARAYAPYRR